MVIDKKNLLQAVKKEEDKPIFEEALNCIKNDSLRAGYIMLWISIVESLQRKIRLLEAEGVLLGVTAAQAITALETSHKSTDQAIVDQAANCGIITSVDKNDLDYLWKKRCLYAHPYNTAPSEVDINHCLDNAVKITIGKDLYLTRNGIDEQIQTLITQAHVMGESDLEREEYMSNLAAKIDPSHYRHTYFKASLAISNLLTTNPIANWQIKRLKGLILAILSNPQVDFTAPEWAMDKSIDQYCRNVWLTAVGLTTWNKFTVTHQNKLFAFLTLENVKNQSPNILPSLNVVYPALSQSRKTELLAFFSKFNFRDIINYYPDLDTWYDRIIAEFTSNQYERENAVVKYLLENPWINKIPNADNKHYELGKRTIWAVKGNAYTAISLVKPLFVEPKEEISSQFYKGIFIGLFIDETGKFNASKLDSYIPVKLIDVMNEQDIQECQSIIVGSIDETTPTDVAVYSSDFRRFVQSDFGDSQIFNAVKKLLSEKMEQYEQEDE
jgi:hypothetical protein